MAAMSISWRSFYLPVDKCQLSRVWSYTEMISEVATLPISILFSFFFFFCCLLLNKILLFFFVFFSRSKSFFFNAVWNHILFNDEDQPFSYSHEKSFFCVLFSFCTAFYPFEDKLTKKLLTLFTWIEN